MNLYSVDSLVNHLAFGIIQADPHYDNYEVPPGFDVVIKDAYKYLKQNADNIYGGFSTIERDVDNLRELIANFIHNHQICKMWNNWNDPGDFVFTSIYSSMPTERQFIDLDAIVQNVMGSINKEQVANQIFEAKFKNAGRIS